MAQQRIKFVKDDPNNTFVITVETDTNTLTAAPVALDAKEYFRLIIHDTLMTESDIADSIQQLTTALRDGQEVLDAVLL